jgi:hypothetical protein
MTQKLEILSIEELEEAKKKAIEEWDGFRYMQLCDALGLIPDVPDLYNLGMAEEFYLRENSNAEKEIVIRAGTKSEANYCKFYEEVQRLHINTRSFVKDIDKKRELLEKYFPKRFGHKAKKPIIDYSDGKAGYVFNILLEQAKKRTGQ